MLKNEWDGRPYPVLVRKFRLSPPGEDRLYAPLAKIDFLGLTILAEALALLAKMQAVITVDSFLMHGAFMQKTPAIVLWRPTNPEVFGYDAHINLRLLSSPCEICQKMADEYLEKCPQGEKLHCMNRFDAGKIGLELKKVLGIR